MIGINKDVHAKIDEKCPKCGSEMAVVKQTGFVFCLHAGDLTEYGCGYEREDNAEVIHD